MRTLDKNMHPLRIPRDYIYEERLRNKPPKGIKIIILIILSLNATCQISSPIHFHMMGFTCTHVLFLASIMVVQCTFVAFMIWVPKFIYLYLFFEIVGCVIRYSHIKQIIARNIEYYVN